MSPVEAMPLRAPLKLLVLMLLVVLGSSCLIVSTNPLIDPKTSTPDKHLLGRWIGTDKLEGVYALFDERSLESNILIGQKTTNRSEAMFDLATGPIGKYRYMSLRPREENIQEYLLARYAIEGDELKIWLLNSSFFDAAISQGHLKTNPTTTSTKRLADSSEAIIDFLVKNQDSEELFRYLGVFRKKKK